MAKAKPTTFAGVTVQTGHALYANLINCFAFIEDTGDALNVKDHVGSDDKLLVDNGDGDWQVATEPYTLETAHNHPGSSTHCTDTDYSYPDQSSFSVTVRFVVDEMDTTSTSRPSAILHSDVFTAFDGEDNNVGIMLLQDSQGGGIVCNVGGPSGRRRVEDIPYTAGTTGWVNLTMVFDYTAASNASTITAYLDGTEYTQDVGTGIRPNDSGTNDCPGGANLGKTSDSASTGGFNGEYDVLYVFDKALSSGEVSALHADIYAPISDTEAGGPTATPRSNPFTGAFGGALRGPL